MIKLFITIIIVLFLLSCKKDPPLFNIQNLNGDTISLFGHGGMGIGFKFPINSYESIEPCLRIGADGTEIDIQMTKDSVLVAFHNYNLNQWASCDGIINDKLWTEIDGCKFSSPYSSQIYVMSMDNLFNRINNLNTYTFTFDCKLYTNTNDFDKYIHQFTNAIIKIIDKYNLDNNIFIESNSKDFLAALKNKINNYKLFILASSFDGGLEIAENLDLEGVSISNNDITKEQIEIAHSKNISITLWDIQTQKDNIDAIQKSPDYIQSDKIIQLLKLFDKYKN